MQPILIAAFLFSIMFQRSEQMDKPSNTPAFDLTHTVRLPKTNIKHPPALLLFHGAGSNEQDIFTFANRIPDEWIVISVRAPYTVSEGHYKWYDVKMVDNKITINFKEEEESREKVIKFIDDIVSFYHIDKTRIVLAGFSQGANIASVVSLTAPEKVTGFAIFSGRFMEEIKPLISKSASLKSLKCFLAHGNQDNMLPIAYAMENQQVLQRLGIPVTFSEDAVAHSISSKQFNDFLVWLNKF